MIQPDRFGPFLLFRKTESNRYRTCFRAGITRGRAVERIVRLETFDQTQCGSAELLEEFEAATDLQARLLDPHIARGAGVGQVGGTPFAAYDFELGTTLAAFSSAARQRSFPVPFDQALFVAERIALALAAAYRIDDGGEPVLHKFLTPDSVLLSNVGEVKVCGFETGGALRSQLAGEPLYAPYCSPEARAGLAPLPIDDVYSLGAILFELVTGRQHATAETDIDEITVQATDEPAPENLKALLKGSFAPPANRIPNVEEWQQTLGKLILDGEYNPTTFNLAFLLHTILREPLEQGVGELEREKRFVLDEAEASVAEAHTATATTGGPDDSRTGSAGLSSAFGSSELLADSARSNRKPFWLGFTVSVLSAGTALVAWLVLGGPSPKAPTATVSAESGLTVPQVQLRGPGNAGSPEFAQPSEFELAPEAIVQEPAAAAVAGSQLVLSEVVHGQLDTGVNEDEVSRVVAERAREIERSLKADYERKLENMRAELAKSRPDDTAPAQQAEAAASASTTSPGLETEKTGQTPQTAAREAEASAQRSASLPARTAPSAQPGTASGNPLASRTDPLAAYAGEPASPPKQATPDPTPSSVAARPEAAARTPDAAEPRTTTESTARARSVPVLEVAEEEAVVTAEAPVEVPVEVPAQLVRLNPPTYPPGARRFGLSATARVKLVISAQGKVEDAEIIGPELGSGFDRAALYAVRRSRWEPAKRNGEPVASTSVVTLEFKP